ncbi:hypothetical protein C8J57DRAFT_34228 [Mycena rebaudengoi]|nr:hypothetical protein C8J57DRAFT_34228 [Mycena rebaudengoi]
MQQPASWAAQGYYSSHYAQAYTQQFAPQTTTPQGYSFSSTYTPPAPSQNRNAAVSAPWYQAGNSRCTYKNCTFQGSAQTVETHMMDRHLIYPPGWDQRKKKPEWDTDPSLKGKPIPIQGTTVILDSPEVLEAWIAERKRRWPSAGRVEEKKRKMEEALASGQLSLEDSGLGRKRRRMDEDGSRDETHRGRGRGGRGRGAERGRGRGTARGRGTDSGWGGRGGARVAAAVNVSAESSSDDSEDDNDDDDQPEQVSSKPVEPPQRVPSPPPPPPPTRRPPRPAPQPKPPARNPFASCPTLLRNLLLPEIRITVSNLSQAIRFLVDNDFLQNVELRPGQANEKMIEVLKDDNASL